MFGFLDSRFCALLVPYSFFQCLQPLFPPSLSASGIFSVSHPRPLPSPALQLYPPPPSAPLLPSTFNPLSASLPTVPLPLPVLASGCHPHLTSSHSHISHHTPSTAHVFSACLCIIHSHPPSFKLPSIFHHIRTCTDCLCTQAASPTSSASTACPRVSPGPPPRRLRTCTTRARRYVFSLFPFCLSSASVSLSDGS